MSSPDAEFVEIFRDEATERLDNVVDALLSLEAGGGSEDTIAALFRDIHTIKGGAGMLGLDDVRMVAHAVEDILSNARDAGMLPRELTAPLLRATDTMRAQLAGEADPNENLLEELATSRTFFERVDPQPDNGTAPVGRVADRRTLRVPAAKIDQLLDLVGETMLYQRRLGHALTDQADEGQEVIDELGLGDRLLDELKDSAIGMRTLPLSSILGPLPRATRDAAAAEGKEVELVVRGSETELDRVILESLSEALIHLLRNAVVHGIESPLERKRVQKQARGRIELRAEQRGSVVEIVVADDGRGLSAETLEEARKQGSVVELLARAGYSTAEEVTDLAGRGVGLDAVRTYVESFAGTLDVESTPGKGTSVVLTLPLALALLEVLLVERGNNVYGVPLAAVEEVLTVNETLSLGGRPTIELRGRSLPLSDLAALVGAAAPPLRQQAPALVVSAGGRRAAAACDALLGEEEVVVKPLDRLVGAQGYLGTAILGDGRIALLLEPAGLTQAPRRATVSAPAPTSVQDATPRILVVEDSFTVRELQRSILEAAGYRVLTARDGRDALATLDREPEIDLVLTDLEMPEVDGIELTRAIRADAVRSALPVVIVTSLASEDDQRRGIAAGADAYMTKRSFDQQALLETVERLVGR